MSNHDKYREAMKRNVSQWKRRKRKHKQGRLLPETHDLMNLMLPPEAHEWAARETLRLQDELQRRIRDRMRRERPDVPLAERGSKLGTTSENAPYLQRVYDEELARLLADQTAEIEGDDQ